MRKLPLIAGAAAIAFAGAGLAAKPRTHIIDVPLADGSVMHVEYVGDVAPKVTLVAPRRVAASDWTTPALPFAVLGQMVAEMNRESDALTRQAQQMAGQPVGAPAGPYVASFGNAPAALTSTTVVSVSNGSGTCTRTTETVSQGAGKPPKVTSSVSGNCGNAAAPALPPPSGPVSHT